MAYNRSNKQKEINHIINVYQQVKQPDIPDTFILRNIFPKHNIFISLRTWVNYKGLKPSEYKQPTLFEVA